jgi:hypothetical protein
LEVEFDMNNRAKTIFLLLFSVLFVNVQANVVTGSTVSYTFDESLLSLFGTPTLIGDSLFFTPTGFFATGNESLDIKNATINLTVTALNGGTISALNLIERGDYIMKGDTAEVGVGGQLRVTDLCSPMTEAVEKIKPDVPFASQTTFLPTQDWTVSAGVDFSGHKASSVNVTIENILLAFSGTFGDLGFIEKKGLIIGATTIPFSQVPLPASLWLFGSALLGFLTRIKPKLSSSN